MKKKGMIFKSWWFWIIIILIIGLIIFFFPKSCGRTIGEPSDTIRSVECPCLGFKQGYYIIDASVTNCYGICIKSSCKTTVSPPNNPPIEEPVENNTSINYTITPAEIPPYTTNSNISLNKSLKLTIKPANPQYKREQDVTLQYTLENIDNKTISITSDIANGIEVKNAGNIVMDYDGNGSGIKIISDSQNIEAGKKVSGSVIIRASDYNFYTIGNIGDGYWNTITAYIGQVKSNRIIVRFV